MIAVYIVAIVFTFTAISTFLENNRKREKDKIDAALRMEEMKRGYQPGTYSNYNSKKDRKKNKHHKYNDDYNQQFNSYDTHTVKEERSKERADLKEGIDDLMTRINNLEVIMESEKEKSEDK